MITASLERPVAQAFVSFGPPVAAASIAQVHRGEVERDGVGKPVAVKVLRPNVASRFRRDLGDFFFVASNAEAYSAEARRLRLDRRSSTRCRARSRWRWTCGWRRPRCPRWRRTPATIRISACPKVDWDRTSHDVLTMEWIDGIALNDHARLAQPQVDLPDLGRKVIQSFLRHALRDGFFHADMHPGNLFLDDAGRLVAVDFGIMGRLGLKERRFLAEILLGFITRDYRRVAEVHFEAGYVPAPSLGREFRAGDPRHRRADPQPHRRRNLDGEAADAAARGDRAVRHADPARTDPAAEDHGGGRGRRARRSIPSSTSGRSPTPWCANGSSAISARSAGSRARWPARATSAAWAANLPAIAARAVAVLEGWRR